MPTLPRMGRQKQISRNLNLSLRLVDVCAVLVYLFIPACATHSPNRFHKRSGT
jgi:hypothetical protein